MVALEDRTIADDVVVGMKELFLLSKELKSNKRVTFEECEEYIITHTIVGWCWQVRINSIIGG